MVDLRYLFGLCLSKEFITKLGGYLVMDYSHIMVPFKDKRVKILNESTSIFHLENKHLVNMAYWGVEELDGLIQELHIKDENNINFHNSIEDIEIVNYVIIDMVIVLLALIKYQLR